MLLTPSWWTSLPNSPVFSSFKISQIQILFYSFEHENNSLPLLLNYKQLIPEILLFSLYEPIFPKVRKSTNAILLSSLPIAIELILSGINLRELIPHLFLSNTLIQGTFILISQTLTLASLPALANTFPSLLNTSNA